MKGEESRKTSARRRALDVRRWIIRRLFPLARSRLNTKFTIDEGSKSDVENSGDAEKSVEDELNYRIISSSPQLRSSRLLFPAFYCRSWDKN